MRQEVCCVGYTEIRALLCLTQAEPPYVQLAQGTVRKGREINFSLENKMCLLTIFSSQ